MKKAVTGSALTALLALGLGGCATVSDADLESLRGDIRAAQDTASQALSESQTARATADGAARDAADAKATANEAKAATEATDARIDQMFKKAMMK